MRRGPVIIVRPAHVSSAESGPLHDASPLRRQMVVQDHRRGGLRADRGSRGGLHRCSPGPARHSPRRLAADRPDRRVPDGCPVGTSLAGDPNWRMTHPGHLYQLEGFTDRADVPPGTSFRLFVSTTAPSFLVRAFRMGWYGGDLSAWCATSPTTPGRYQPGARIVQPGSMAVAPWSPSLTVPTAGWPPGSYLLRLDASTGVQSYVPMVIRSPSTAGRVVLVSAVTSYQAYNGWGRYSRRRADPRPAPTPSGSFADRGRRVTFDRPLLVRPRGRPTSSSSCRWSPTPSDSGCRWPISPASTSTWTRACGRRPRHDQRGARRVLVTGHAGRRHAGP